VRGQIASRWRIENGQFLWQITVPPDTDAEVHVPTTDAGQVTENGRPARQAQGITFLRAESAGSTNQGVGRAIFKIGSGAYEFRSPF
jgi:alpha-L-rhamnosidase